MMQAWRHGELIPWDTDIDIGVPVESFDQVSSCDLTCPVYCVCGGAAVGAQSGVQAERVAVASRYCESAVGVFRMVRGYRQISM